MTGNDNITIYFGGVNPITRQEDWTRLQVRCVVWEDRKAANVLRSGILEADRVAIYIPLARGELGLKPGDVVVRGLVSEEIDVTFTLADLKHKYPDCITVRSVDRMDRGSLALRHYQVGGS